MNNENLEYSDDETDEDESSADDSSEEAAGEAENSEQSAEENPAEIEWQKKRNRYLFIGAAVVLIALGIFSGTIRNYFTGGGAAAAREQSTDQPQTNTPIILREKVISDAPRDRVTALSLPSAGAPGAESESLVTLTESGTLKVLNKDWEVTGEFKSPDSKSMPGESLSEKIISFASGAGGALILSGTENGRVSQYARNNQNGTWTKRELFTFRDSTAGLDKLVATGTITHILINSDNSRGAFFNYDGQGVIISRDANGYSPSGKISLAAGLVTGGFAASGKLWTVARDGTFAIYDVLNPQKPEFEFGVGDFAFLYGADWNGKRLVVCGDNPDSPIPVIGVYGADGKGQKLLRSPAGAANYDYQNSRVAQQEASVATVNQPGNYFSQVSWVGEEQIGAVFQNNFTVFDLKRDTLQQITFNQLAPGESLTGFKRRSAAAFVFGTDRGRILDAEIHAAL